MSRDFARLSRQSSARMSREGFARPRRDGEAMRAETMTIETIGAAARQAPGRT
jgi:hypothetical protein